MQCKIKSNNELHEDQHSDRECLDRCGAADVRQIHLHGVPSLGAMQQENTAGCRSRDTDMANCGGPYTSGTDEDDSPVHARDARVCRKLGPVPAGTGRRRDRRRELHLHSRTRRGRDTRRDCRDPGGRQADLTCRLAIGHRAVCLHGVFQMCAMLRQRKSRHSIV